MINEETETHAARFTIEAFRIFSFLYLAISRTQYFPIETEEGEVGGTTRERSASRHKHV